MKAPVNVVILAAGLGTRMKSKRAKVLHRAGGLTLIEQVVRTALSMTSPDHVTVVVGHQAEEVKTLLASSGVRFVHQAEQKGTGHALLLCREALASQGGLVVTLYGDAPLFSSDTLRALVDRQDGSDAAATVITARVDDPTGYGRMVFGERGELKAIVEHKAATPEQLAIGLINSGIYCFRAELLWKYISQIRTNNAAHEYYLTDMVEILNGGGHWVAAMEVVDSEEVLGINTRVELAVVDRVFRERKTRQLMLDGVTIEKPETVTIDDAAQIGRDSIVEPFAQILGRTEIGEDCRIGACSIVENSKLAGGVHVLPFTSVQDSQLETGVRVGPFARLRNGNRVGAGARIGNFVELKNTKLGAGAKANHLAYLGDSEVGDKSNIGAGTITCNYDGVNKHRTVIGKDAFTGSNSTLVAPVEIGDAGYVAAGSVITDNVPPGALALGRSRQVVKEGWVAKKKKKK
ncbi:MAG TPA: bifunctional UDP-N-acetylglucosamine diphosphorylase/glucosamine-1-phosphate N-acetyltransferase GlmU [Bryobacteraceae bacterium]|nr:bifunctional UDP-N-acetylglucosamine diphosphorylase/glucosamine-1-phosphate N-acetyltransferase GlmU [Bryobacteraceae bacterium]